MHPLVPAASVLTVGVGAILVADEELIRRGHEPVTRVLQTVPGLVGLGLLVGHVFGVMPRRLDPFRSVQASAERVEGWVSRGAHVP